MPNDSKETQTTSEFYPPYSEFSKTLRTWFVAYGIGGPVVLLANEKAWTAIVASGCSFHIGLLFLIGGALQVVSAFFNKHAMWHMYICEIGPYDTEEDKKRRQCLKERRPYKIAEWYSEQNWIDELLDLYTLVVFAWATALAFKVLSSPLNKQFTCNDETSSLAWILGVILAAVVFLIRLMMALRKPPAQIAEQEPRLDNDPKGPNV